MIDSKSLNQDDKSQIQKFSDVWHSRLGHPFKIVLGNNDCLKNKTHGNLFCEIYPLAKQTRLPFSSTTNVSFDCFDLFAC